MQFKMNRYIFVNNFHFCILIALTNKVLNSPCIFLERAKLLLPWVHLYHSRVHLPHLRILFPKLHGTDLTTAKSTKIIHHIEIRYLTESIQTPPKRQFLAVLVLYVSRGLAWVRKAKFSENISLLTFLRI